MTWKVTKIYTYVLLNTMQSDGIITQKIIQQHRNYVEDTKILYLYYEVSLVHSYNYQNAVLSLLLKPSDKLI